MAKKLKSLRCPTCRKIVLKTEPEFPFCSEHCRAIDLGKWASGGYVISSPISDPENLTEAELDAISRGGRSGEKRKDDDIGEDFKGSRRPQ
jgi:endogenous inhibitor of DNA gyrase (YacG/DUF329 family)